MIYQFDSRVRYSEVDENRRITLLSILNYFQDCSSFHSEKIGVGIDYLNKKQCAWVLSSGRSCLRSCRCLNRRSPFRPGHILLKDFSAKDFCIRDEKGEKLAQANTLWTYVDLKTGHPTQSSRKRSRKRMCCTKSWIWIAPRKIALPEKMEKRVF